MKTTIRLDDDLYAEVKHLAACGGRTLSSLIEDSLRVTLATNRAVEQAPLSLRTFRGNGLFPGVHLDRSEALLDLMVTPHKRN